MQIFRCCHDRELNSPFITKRLVGPFSDGPNLLDSCDTVVGDQYLETSSVSTCDHSIEIRVKRRCTNRANDGVTFILGNKIPHSTRCRSLEMIPTDEMRRNLRLGAGSAVGCGIRNTHYDLLSVFFFFFLEIMNYMLLFTQDMLCKVDKMDFNPDR